LNRTEAIFIREQDTIILPGATSARLRLEYDPAEVQVTSSVAAAADARESEGRLVDSNTHKSGGQGEQSETEDEDLDKTITVNNSQSNGNSKPFRATPAASVPRSDIVQETPTIDRILPLNNISKVRKISDTSNAVADTPPGEDATVTCDEPFSTALTKPYEKGVGSHSNGGSQDIKYSNKVFASITSPEMLLKCLEASRPLATSDETPNTTDEGNRSQASETPSEPPRKSNRGRPKAQISEPKGIKRKDTAAVQEEEAVLSRSRTPKRRKTDEIDTQDSSLSNIYVDASASKPKTPVTNSKGRNATREPASSRTKTPDSSSVDSELLYRGDQPVVAFSNTTIQERLQLMKFLERHGGTQVEVVKPGQCNLLCVKEGALRKSMKLLLCIALGIPIVTDKWLIDSSKKGCFLSLEPYMPSVPAQERDWKFSISDIWGKPQSDILTGYIMYFTPSCKDSYSTFKEIEQVCKAVGAERITSKPARDVKDDQNGMILIGQEENDIDCAVLLEHNCTVYTRDFLTNSILRGGIDLDSDEFTLKGDGSSQREKPKKKGGRSRKS
jgi:hypothetical protein